jgi:hypothetical protein
LLILAGVVQTPCVVDQAIPPPNGRLQVSLDFGRDTKFPHKPSGDLV